MGEARHVLGPLQLGHVSQARGDEGVAQVVLERLRGLVECMQQGDLVADSQVAEAPCGQGCSHSSVERLGREAARVEGGQRDDELRGVVLEQGPLCMGCHCCNHWPEGA